MQENGHCEHLRVENTTSGTECLQTSLWVIVFHVRVSSAGFSCRRQYMGSLAMAIWLETGQGSQISETSRSGEGVDLSGAPRDWSYLQSSSSIVQELANTK